MSADVLQHLETLLLRDPPPEQLTLQATLILSQASQADFAGLYIGNADTHTFHTVHQDPELSTAILSYLEHRSRSPTPLARKALANAQPIFVNNYKDHPDARGAAIHLGINTAAYLPLGHHSGLTFIATVIRASTTPTLAHNSPWTEDQQTLMRAVAHKVQAALARSSSDVGPSPSSETD